MDIKSVDFNKFNNEKDSVVKLVGADSIILYKFMAISFINHANNITFINTSKLINHIDCLSFIEE